MQTILLRPSCIRVFAQTKSAIRERLHACCLLAAIVGLLTTASGCAMSATIPQQRYVFSFVVDESPPDRAFVIWEDRVVTESIEGPIAARLSRVTGGVFNDGTFECTVSANEITGLGSESVPMLTIASGRDYRFTVFVPGCIAETVFPYGIYREPPAASGPINRWDGPGLVDGAFAHSFVTADCVSKPLAWTRGRDGMIDCSVAIKPLPSHAELEAMLKSTGSLETGYPINLFVYQVWLVANAIQKGYLADVPVEDRKVLVEAIRAQHDCYGGDRMRECSYHDKCRGQAHGATFDECAMNPKSPCHVIHTWACQSKE